MPYGGKYQLTETQTMVAKLPVLKGKTDAVTMMSYGFDPYLSSWSPYHGAVYAVLDVCGEDRGGRRRLQKDPLHLPGVLPQNDRGSDTAGASPFAALLGAYNAQLGFGLPSIGGKDSMSGTFNEEMVRSVPPTLVSFAVDVASEKNIITPEFKKAGNKLVVFAD